MAVTRTIDFTNVRDSAKFTKRRVPTGDYLAKVIKVEDAVSSKDQQPQYLFTIELIKHRSATYPYYCKITENQLWKLRNLLVAAGINVPKKKLKVDPNRAVNRTIAVSMEDDEYEGREQSVVASIFPAAELTLDGTQSVDKTEDEEVSDEEPETEEAEEESAEEESDQFEDMDRAALKVFIREHDVNFKFLKSHSDDDLRAAARGFGAAEEELEEEEAEEEPEPEPVKPARRRRAAKPVVEETEELDIDDL